MKNIFSCISLRSELFATLLISTSLFCTLSLKGELEDPFKVTRGHSSHRPKEKECRECDFVITAKDIACGSVVITRPGYYCLCEDAVFNPSPASPYIGAIVISASNVTLDLRGRTLSQISKTVQGVDGIIVEPGFTNIIIKNGTVRDFSDAGIRAGAVSTTPVPLVTELSISDIRSFNNGLPNIVVNPGFSTGDGIGGAVILNAQDVTITNSDFNENFLDGLWALNITKLTMENNHFDDNTPGALAGENAPTTYGAVVTGVSADVLIRKCTFNKNTSGGFAAGFNLGFSAPTTASLTNVVFDSCQFNDNSATISDPTVAMFLGEIGGTFALGIEVIAVTNLTFTNCEADGATLTFNTPLTPPSPTLNGNTNSVRGYNIQGCSNVKMINCTSSGLKFQNNALPAVAVRTFAQSFELSFINQLYMSNCHSYGNTNVYDGLTAPASQFLAEGFDLYTVANVVVEDCTSSGHSQMAGSAPEGQFSFAAGFKADAAFCCPCESPCGPVVFRRCVANGNTGSLDAYAFGFSTRDPLSAGTPTAPNSCAYVFESCIAENNTSDSGTGYGLDVLNLIDSEIINCIANHNNIGINVSDLNTLPCVPCTPTSPPCTFGSADNIFSGNVLSANTLFGIQDTSAAKSNAYYANRAKNNGPTPATTNYSGAEVFPVPSCSTTTLCCVPANLTPVLYWTLPNAPCTLNTNCIESTPLDNLSIVN